MTVRRMPSRRTGILLAALAFILFSTVLGTARARAEDELDGIQPLLDCVASNPDGSYTAYFSYRNDNDQAFTVPPGKGNRLSPIEEGTSLPTTPATFAPGGSPRYPNSTFGVRWDGSALTWILKGPDGSTRTATADSSSPACRGAGVSVELFSAAAGTVTWKVRPGLDGDYRVWDSQAESCRAFFGASCGSIGSGSDAGGTLWKGATGQYLLVTHSYRPGDGQCKVQGDLMWQAALADGGRVDGRERAVYRCSGASALGWPALAAGFVGAVGVAWVVNRRHRWSR